MSFLPPHKINQICEHWKGRNWQILVASGAINCFGICWHFQMSSVTFPTIGVSETKEKQVHFDLCVCAWLCKTAHHSWNFLQLVHLHPKSIKGVATVLENVDVSEVCWKHCMNITVWLNMCVKCTVLPWPEKGLHLKLNCKLSQVQFKAHPV